MSLLFPFPSHSHRIILIPFLPFPVQHCIPMLTRKINNNFLELNYNCKLNDSCCISDSSVICGKFQKQTTLSYRQMSVLDTAVMFVGSVLFLQALLIASPYSEIQPQPGPSLKTTNQSICKLITFKQ